MEYYIRKQLSVIIIIYTGQIMIGFGMGWTAPMIPKLEDPEQTPLPEVISSSQASWIGSVLYIGTIIGPYISGYLSDVYGRKPALMLGATLTIFSFVLLAISTNIAMILAGRIFTGLGTGIIAVINLVYIGEIASTNIRGMLLSGTAIFGTLGTLVVYSVGPWAPYYVSSVVGIGITVIYLFGLFFIPESPMFHILKGQQDKATDILHLLGRKEDVDNLLQTKHAGTNQAAQWKDLFSTKGNRKALFITFFLGLLQQLSGIIVVVFFATTIFQLAGSSIEPNVATIIIGITQLTSSTITPFFVEGYGRKLLLMMSTAVCCVSLATLGTYFYLDHLELPLVTSIQWLPLVTIIIFFFSYDMGFGIIPPTFVGEMFNSNVRSVGSALTTTSGWLFGFGVSVAFGYLIDIIGGHGTFWIFSGACAIAFVFTAIFVPETKGLSLNEIQAMLNK